MSLLALHGVPAPAKLNLFLHVTGRREDGYHLLQSLFVLIDWADRLDFTRRDDGRLERIDLGPPLPPEDLCLRAARALQAAAGCRFGATIGVHKRVPSGAGLGGGSSDAATVLLALNRLWGLHWPRPRLAEIGATLGADVPFFVGGHNAWVEGIGERLVPLIVPVATYAVVHPGAALATADVFRHPGLDRSVPPHILAGFLGNEPDPAASALAEGTNSLQPVAETICPAVRFARHWLDERFGAAGPLAASRMTGSGSAVFTRIGAGALPSATFPQAELPAGWSGRLCRSLEAHPLAGWAEG
jgi:4-diphosphocytidyl-2-C-methyl-D-erythritol kinase